MAKCKKCGTFVSKDDIFCPVCKTKIDINNKEKNNEAVKKAFRTNDFSGSFSAQDKEYNKIFALLCYIPIICLYPILVTSKKSPYVRFHAGQGLALFAIELIVSVIFTMLSILILPIPIIGVILSLPVSLLGWALELATLAATVYGVYQSLTGKAREMPIIGKFRFFK